MTGILRGRQRSRLQVPCAKSTQQARPLLRARSARDLPAPGFHQPRVGAAHHVDELVIPLELGNTYGEGALARPAGKVRADQGESLARPVDVDAGDRAG